MPDSLTDRLVLVSGGASGLGAAVVDVLLERGARPHVLDLVAPKQDVAIVLERVVPADLPASSIVARR